MDWPHHFSVIESVSAICDLHRIPLSLATAASIGSRRQSSSRLSGFGVDSVNVSESHCCAQTNHRINCLCDQRSTSLLFRSRYRRRRGNAKLSLLSHNRVIHLCSSPVVDHGTAPNRRSFGEMEGQHKLSDLQPIATEMDRGQSRQDIQ